MISNVTITKDRYPGLRQFSYVLFCWVLALLMFSGCRTTSPGKDTLSESGKQQVFDLEHLGSEQCIAFLSQLGISKVSKVPDANTVLVTGSSEQLDRASLVLRLVDTSENFVIENLGPASMVRSLPSNSQFATALGDIRIGTFTNPPQTEKQAKGIIDIHGDAVVAIIPARHRKQLLYLLKRFTSETLPIYPSPVDSEYHGPHPTEDTSEITADVESTQTKSRTLIQDKEPTMDIVVQIPDNGYPHEGLGPQMSGARPELSFPGEKKLYPDTKAQVRTDFNSPIILDNGSAGVPRTLRIVLKPARNVREDEEITTESGSVELQNGEDILDMALPETMTLMQLLDLAGEYLDLDYVYDTDVFSKQSVTLKLHGSLQGEMKVKDLYTLLETVLKFKGFAMIRREDKLVTIVPVAQALDADPQLVHVESKAVQAGDMVVTRVFELQHVDVASVTNLLKNMKLGVVVSPSDEGQILFVTCYAHRMGRIEQLVSMLDRPGRARECRFRRLQYTLATAVANKVRALAQQLQGVQVTMASAAGKSTTKQDKGTAGSGQAVYLDTDERTNRILMIGHEEQLSLLEELIDALDVVQEDLRLLKVYDIEHIDAEQVRMKLQEMEITDQAEQEGTSRRTSRSSSSTTTGTITGAMAEKAQVVVLTTTNQLLINATKEQHAKIATIINYVDVVPEDLRFFKVYDMKYLDAEEVKNKLDELEVMGKTTQTGELSRRVSRASPSVTTERTGMVAQAEDPEVVILAATNSLLINATEEQHAKIASVISFLDTEVSEQAIPYEIYFLENQEPARLAGVLEKVIQETVLNKEGKIEKVIQRTDEQILVVPDEATFSIIVYANKKNQEWINKLINTLDRRRPQVLIDVTLVEIRKTDEFDYDLNLISSLPDLVETGGQTGSFFVDETTTVVDKLLQPGMRDRFVDFQVNAGSGTGFYADRHVNALLQAIQTKNYGRVLAKPKILVNDNEAGTIKTTDTTFVTKKSSIPVTSGAGGQQSTLIETAIDYESYEAGITLGITPHISEGDLLRLEIELTRSDFVNVTGEKPPDQTGSDVKTVVTVPDGSTIILGGMLKLNQSKGGSKVPILGDLPLVGLLFRSSEHSNIQSKLYVFVRAEIIRPADALASARNDMKRISDLNRIAFEKHEEEFQNYQYIPGLKPKKMDPAKVLEAR